MNFVASLFCSMLFSTGAVASAIVEIPQSHDDVDQPLRTFLDTWCVKCHSGEKPKGRLDFSSFVRDESRTLGLKTLNRVRDALSFGDMPPPESDARPQPRDVATMIAQVDAALRRQAMGEVHASTHDFPAVTIRRLNRVEYRNTIRDLLNIDFDAESFLPADDVGEGFDNIGDVLSMPPLLFEKYLDAAERIAQQAYPDPLPEVPAVRRVPGSQLTATNDQSGAPRGELFALWSNGAAVVAHEFPVSGRYRLSVEAAGQQAGPEPVKMTIHLERDQLQTFEVKNTIDSPATFEVVTTIEQGTRRVGAAFINDYYNRDHPNPQQRDRNCIVYAISIEGPLDAGAGSGVREPIANRETPRVIRDLASRAFRQPVTQTDVAELLELSDDTELPEARVRAALTAMLVSSRFLFRPEFNTGEARDLNGYELASRLSYFLWSSMPDDELLRVAREGTLASRDEFQAQVDRMMADPRSFALAENFATQWLHVRDLESRTPDNDRFPGVDRALLESMKAETMLMFDAVLREDRDVRELLQSDFTFVDERLASHYNLPGVRGDYMRRIKLPVGVQGGVITQASVLTATSNPTRTSPVKRGKWILEALLDAPPPPPPPGVDSFETAKDKAAGLTSIREILARHRSDPNCAVCHRRMDALGFALEQYDAVGRYRLSDDGRPVDSSGELPDGRKLTGAADLRQLLLGDTAFHRSLARHMLIYALGRGLTDSDEYAVASLVEAMQNEPTIRSLIRAIVQLDQFQRVGG